MRRNVDVCGLGCPSSGAGRRPDGNPDDELPFDPQLIDPKKSADARRLFELEQIEVSWDEPTGALWTFMRPRGRPSYNLDLLEEFHAWQRGIMAEFGDRPEI